VLREDWENGWLLQINVVDGYIEVEELDTNREGARHTHTCNIKFKQRKGEGEEKERGDKRLLSHLIPNTPDI
jgi:hypothetical protein